MKRIFLLALTLILFSVQSVKSEKLMILTEDLPPLNYLEDGKLVGPSVEIVKEIQKRVGSKEPIQVYPWARAYKIALENENVVLFGTTQTETRQNLFKWVGPLAIKRDVLIARKGTDMTVNNLEDARNVMRIGVLRGDTREQFLEAEGFTNLEPVSDDKQNAQKLVLGRIDLWAYKKPGMITVCRLAGVDPDEMEEVLHLRQIEVSIAFSKRTADSIVLEWDTAFQAMINDGTMQQIIDKWNQER